MREALPIALGCDAMNFPGTAGVLPIRFGIHKISAGIADDLGFAVTGDIHETGRFVVGHFDRDVFLPMTFAAFWVFIPRRIFARKTSHDDVGPAVAIEVV